MNEQANTSSQTNQDPFLKRTKEVHKEMD